MDQKQQAPYPLRISAELRDRLEQSAEAARRSLNTEISDRLERSFGLVKEPEVFYKTVTLAIARAEQDAAAAELAAEERLYTGALIAKALLESKVDQDAGGSEPSASKVQLHDVYAKASRLLQEAQDHSDKAAFEVLTKRALAAEQRLAEAKAALRETSVVSERRSKPAAG